MDRDAIICLAATGDRAELRLAGGELVAWRVANRNLLWMTDPAIWPRTSPMLFPIVGRARNGEISIDGRKYPMGIHGFAATSRFVPVSQSQDSTCLRLTDDAVTRASFPFSFQLDVTYRLASRQLGVAFAVTNTGDAPLPYALGWHPGFAWPFSSGRRDDYAIAFERPERPEVPVITADGLFSGSRRHIPLAGRDLPLSESLMSKEALAAAQPSLRFAAPDGAAIRLSCRLPHIALVPAGAVSLHRGLTPRRPGGLSRRHPRCRRCAFFQPATAGHGLANSKRRAPRMITATRTRTSPGRQAA